MLNQTILGSRRDLRPWSGCGHRRYSEHHDAGPLLQTGVTTDLAIGGNGFFVCRRKAGGLEGNFYSRNGQFRIDNDGFLANQQVCYCKDTQMTQGNIAATVGNLQVGMATSPPNSTTSIELNLTSIRMPVDTNAFNPADPLDPDPIAAPPNAQAAFSTSVPLYDSLGNDHDVEVYFVSTLILGRLGTGTRPSTVESLIPTIEWWCTGNGL